MSKLTGLVGKDQVRESFAPIGNKAIASNVRKHPLSEGKKRADIANPAEDHKERQRQNYCWEFATRNAGKVAEVCAGGGRSP